MDSSGLHANGASLARRIAAQLPDGYGFELPSGTTFGRALLEPSLIYVPLVRALLDSDVHVHYLSHITGHGFLKLMRPRAEFTYEIDVAARGPRGAVVPGRPSAEMSAAEAYQTFNMGAGFAVYCAAGEGDAVVALGGRLRHARPRRRPRPRRAAARGPAGTRRHVRVRRARSDPARLSRIRGRTAGCDPARPSAATTGSLPSTWGASGSARAACCYPVRVETVQFSRVLNALP